MKVEEKGGKREGRKIVWKKNWKEVGGYYKESGKWKKKEGRRGRKKRKEDVAILQTHLREIMRKNHERHQKKVEK